MKYTVLILMPLGVLALLLVGCADELEVGGGAVLRPEVTTLPADMSAEADTTGSSGSSSTGASSAETSAADAGGVGSFKGKVVLTGSAPSLPLPLLHSKGAAVKDAAACSAEDVPDEKLVVGAENGVANVFVYLARAPKGVDIPDAPSEPILFDQKSCRFIPHCLVVPTGQPVAILNADSVPHNAHTYPTKNSSINQVVSANEREGKLQVVYKRAESLPLAVKCDYHTWMVAYHLPLDHPFAAVTDENGEFEIPNLPAGDYEFVVWHEAAGYVHRKFKAKVTGGEPQAQVVDFDAGKLSL